MNDRAFAPHCDPAILHSPGACRYCDDYPDWQHYRELARISFSDQEPSLDRCPCPSLWGRAVRDRDQWHGNVARPEGEL